MLFYDKMDIKQGLVAKVYLSFHATIIQFIILIITVSST